MAREGTILALRCMDDGALVLDTPESLGRHLGHKLVETYPTWWERVRFACGWRP